MTRPSSGRAGGPAATAQRRSWLVECLETGLLPELERRGFRPVPLTPEEVDSEIAFAFPFGRLRREREGILELVEIQLDKRGAAAFRLNFGTVPPGGVDHEVVGRIPPEDVWASYLDRYYELYEVAWRWAWFSASRLPWARPSRGDYEELVGRVAGHLGEVDAVFRGEPAGDHVREVRVR